MGKSAKATRGGNKMRKNPVRDVTGVKGDSLKMIAKKAAERLDNVSKKGGGGALVKGAPIPQNGKGKTRIVTVSKKKKCVIR